jgi:hypothetical protein
MHVIENILTHAEIDSLREIWRRVENRKYVNFQHEDGRIVDHRYPLDQDPDGWALVEKIVYRNFPDATGIWSALQRQSNPHSIHIDNYLHETLQSDEVCNTWTYIIPLETIPEFRVIIWQERAVSNAAMQARFPEFTERKSHLSESEWIDHLPRFGDLNAGDCFTLDGIFSYRKGAGCLFGAKQFHTTNNWRRYPQHTFRELLQIHLFSESEPVFD